MISRDKFRLGRDQSGPYENGQIKLDCVVGTRLIASAVRFIARDASLHTLELDEPDFM